MTKGSLEMNTRIPVEFESLVKIYLERARKESELIHQSIDGVCEGRCECLEEIGNSAHRLAGAATMFGLHEICNCAVQLERLAESVRLSDDRSFEFHALQILALHLDRALERANREGH